MAQNLKLLTPIYQRAMMAQKFTAAMAHNRSMVSPMTFACYQRNGRTSLAASVALQKSSLMLPATSAAALRVVHNNSGQRNVVVRSFASKDSEPSSKITLPDREQVERYFFRTLAFIYDCSVVILNWSMRVFQKYVLNNVKVQEYWKLLLDKMEKSKRD